MPNDFAQTVRASLLPEFFARYPQIALACYPMPSRVDQADLAQSRLTRQSAWKRGPVPA